MRFTSPRSGFVGVLFAVSFAGVERVASAQAVEILKSSTVATGEQFGAAVEAAPLFPLPPDDWVIVGVPLATAAGFVGAGEVEFIPPASSTQPAFAIRAPGTHAQANAHFGFSLATGDVDGDGTTDVVVGAPDQDNGTGVGLRIDEGQVFVFFGPWSPTSTPPYSGWCRMLPQERNSATAPGAQFGWSVEAGSLDSVADDVVVGVPGATFQFGPSTYTNCGAADVFLTLAPNGGTPAFLRHQHITPWGPTALTGDRMGHDVEIGQFAVNTSTGTGSSWRDIVVTAPFADRVLSGGITYVDAGVVNFFYGRNVGGAPVWGTASSAYFDPKWAPFALAGANLSNQNYGFSVDAADHDGDSWDDLAIGAPCTNSTLAIAPYVMMFRGVSTGATTYPPGYPADGEFIPSTLFVANNLFGTRVRWLQRASGSTVVLDLAVSMVTTNTGVPGQIDRIFIYDGVYSPPASPFPTMPLSVWPLVETIDDNVPSLVDAKFGASLCAASRNPTIGIDEIVIGAPFGDTTLPTSGRVEVH